MDAGQGGTPQGGRTTRSSGLTEPMELPMSRRRSGSRQGMTTPTREPTVPDSPVTGGFTFGPSTDARAAPPVDAATLLQRQSTEPRDRGRVEFTQPSPRLNIKDLDIQRFNPDEMQVEEWATQVQASVRADEQIKGIEWPSSVLYEVLASKLDGPARTWFVDVNQTISPHMQTWDLLIDMLTREFGRNETVAEVAAMLNARKKLPTETWRQYASSLRELGAGIPGMEQWYVSAFVNGIPEEIGRVLRGSMPRSLTSAMNQARVVAGYDGAATPSTHTTDRQQRQTIRNQQYRQESEPRPAFNARARAAPVLAAGVEPATPYRTVIAPALTDEDNGHATGAAMATDPDEWAEFQRWRQQRAERNACFNCGDAGHYARDCREPPRRNRNWGFGGRGRGRTSGFGRGWQGRGPAPARHYGPTPAEATVEDVTNQDPGNASGA